MLHKCCGECERVEPAHRRDFLRPKPPRCEICGTLMVRVIVNTPEDERRMWLLAKKAAFQPINFHLYAHFNTQEA